ncbi:hypothetical protein HD597_010509 [Nonomuraea thailandensis]|uniref:Uncharacterized protein n=1 Tax=Nonomuraea thailandensis TaxID=1188745 RepID=A0A9X2K8F5_9ACTN|nr:hypothetical protein [Nonomuraea thailandensis]MCP2363489.1 hypothetical protein [Nonomuraea thailandensis]
MLHVWSGDEDYWDSVRVESPEPFAHGSGLALFEAAHARLSSVGVRVPGLYFADGGRGLYPADVAVIEDVRGGTLEARLGGAEPIGRAAAELEERLREASYRAGGHRRVRTGRQPLRRRPFWSTLRKVS